MVLGKQMTIKGYKEKPLKSILYKQSDETQKIALVFPGLAYSSTMPLLHYSTQTILAAGINVLSVDYDYSNNQEFLQQSLKEKSEWLISDVEAALEYITKKEKQEVICLAGKSLGTLALGHLLETQKNLRSAKTIWLTPLIKNPDLLEQMLAYMKDAIMVIGTSDPQYDSDIIDRLNANTQLGGIVVDGANHSLEIEGDVTKSLRVLMQIVTIIQQFLT
jgi:dipeptidyl aminopeptidase/acylaminoacyl peptidase